MLRPPGKGVSLPFPGSPSFDSDLESGWGAPGYEIPLSRLEWDLRIQTHFPAKLHRSPRLPSRIFTPNLLPYSASLLSVPLGTAGLLACWEQLFFSNFERIVMFWHLHTELKIIRVMQISILILLCSFRKGWIVFWFCSLGLLTCFLTSGIYLRTIIMRSQCIARVFPENALFASHHFFLVFASCYYNKQGFIFILMVRLLHGWKKYLEITPFHSMRWMLGPRRFYITFQSATGFGTGMSPW